jgi:hypothetical protein
MRPRTPFQPAQIDANVLEFVLLHVFERAFVRSNSGRACESTLAEKPPLTVMLLLMGTAPSVATMRLLRITTPPPWI